MSRASFGFFLRGAREAQRISLRRAAKAARISPTYLSDVELDRCVPSTHVARRLADAIGLDVVEVLARRALAAAPQTLDQARETVRREEGL